MSFLNELFRSFQVGLDVGQESDKISKFCYFFMKSLPVSDIDCDEHSTLAILIQSFG